MSRSPSDEISPSESDGNEQETPAGGTRVEGGSADAEQSGTTPDLPETGQVETGGESGPGDRDVSEGLPEPEASGSDGEVSDEEVSPEEGDPPSEEAKASQDDPFVQLEKARTEAADNYDRYLRAVAELDNFRKRAVRMRAESREETLRDLLLQIAPLMDNMRRALVQEAAEAQSLTQGVERILTQFQAILNGYGLEEIEAVGKPFDPNLHEAMLQVESADCEPGTVLEEMEKGYRLREKVLRPARVVVSKAPADEGDSEDSGEE